MKTDILDKICCFLAELIGTALLVFLGCMGCIKYGTLENNHLQMVINFGLTIMIIVQIFGCVSGSHINPAVTAAAFVYKLLTWQMAIVYFVGQMLGGFIGFGLLKAMVPNEAIFPNNSTEPGLCTTVPRADLHPGQAVAIEFMVTSCLILVVCAVWDPRNAKYHDSVTIRFGLAVAALACAAGPFTGGSMNPARSFGPALWNWHFKHHWVYWVGPLSAGFLSSLGYRMVFYRELQEPEYKKPTKEEIPLSISTN